ncbi:MAG: chromosome segregation protein SMC [Lachnospiraceae bacterium]|nr:chromosome segregation protein SMC [Lachnospiraceae bacterium]
MYLKKIEAQGFKSFANKTVLEFNPGIMGIVGPNGSGKSNVVDAVRWVLGEQSAKQLRGSNMQDVIFAGTASRKPQGYAYVTLTIDNGDHALSMDYEDIIITRRVYRSGESEYLINGNTCRLRDINELFYDTGVGKEGYSIIGQGQIDKILSTKPEDRRELFDEAAGIVKFKKRKDISLKKLETEQNNLLRVTDVLNELEKQIGPIRQQAATARTYLKLRDELKVYEVGAFYRESEELRKRLASATEKLEIAKADYEQASGAASELTRKYEEVSGQRDTLDKQIEEDREVLSAVNVEKENLEGRIRVLEEQVGTLKSAEAELKERLAVLDKKRRVIAAEKEGFTAEKGEINDKIDAAYDAIAAAEKEIEDQNDVIRLKEHELETMQNDFMEELKTKADITADSQGIAVRIEQAELRKNELSKSLEALKEKDSETRQQLKTIAEQLSSVKKILSEKESEIRTKSEKLASLTKKATECEQELAAKVSAYNVAASRVESLRNMAERYNGYGESIKHVMNARASKDAVRGVVADIISVDKKYEVAIETALGGHIQNVVTKDERTAKDMIEYLKREKLGRVTFLPMDAVKGNDNIDTRALAEPGIIDTADNLVKYDPQYKGIVARLLGRIFVAEDVAKALAVAKKYNYRLHIVTPQGEYLAPGGSITGGAFRNTSNLLSRKRELETLEKELSTLAAEGEALKGTVSSLHEDCESLSAVIEELTQARNAAGIREAALTAQQETAEAEKLRVEAEITEKLAQNEELLAVIAGLSEKAAEGENAAKEAEEAESRRMSETQALAQVIDGEREKLKELGEKLTALRLELSKAEERDSFLIENINRINNELEAIDDEKRELLMKSDPEGLAALAKEREKDKLLRRTAELGDQATELFAKVAENTSKRDELSAAQRSLLAEKDESTERAAKLDKDMLRLSNQQERINEQIEAQAKYLWDEYEMTPIEDEAQKYEGSESLSQLRAAISERKNAIKELGPVNVNAIEEEKEVGERYEFLSAQHEDLVKARDSILEVIKELEAGMKKQFEEKFAAIKTEFDKVFKELFGGGQGTIELVPEPDGDMLKAGVSIIAQPPGKKLQNMLQLSGGEKALTAIALIFAIQNLKPSPFCLLDEIEAALDETNVARFADYLERLKTTTQLITITHRRGTMEAADKLYGITMQEKGISTLVSVNLTDAQDKYSEEKEKK